ncbi:fungal-specific transcription factor domain-containing protein [Xylariomycetidae sp. FL2044]|nr:fungal-specific transcription factor domain-containing protein [Xylariomycetidae sp. FL2044]KAH9883282.1 fungal-specific transcription factor domain-containing protein [Xylariomycetidae sp. FL2044]KAH9900057.1 fungal-specific transcription factor domain-containing protein [Xylariomycetidae sp. FL2044]
MPGILPMKVIKVGTSSQSRIAQACDRCRSKKIRCDGIRPTCSQCANVGFECRTSDKLSRRAFPRGYTESLEERVRQLETEVRELKDLLDEKDEKIDMLSKIHGNRAPSVASAASPRSVERTRDSASPAKDDVFRIQASPLLLGVENSDSYFMGHSSGRAFIESFKRKIQENGKSCSDFNPEAFLHIQGCYPLVAKAPSQAMRVPPRLFSDRCVNVYFQEWAPLFPVLHKPTFLHVYEDFVADSEKLRNNHKIAQLYLVFSIAALSSELPDTEQIAACEMQWQRALDAIIMDNTMHTLQCLVLALMYCTVRADYKRLQHYKGVAVGLSHRLGLHQSQKRFSFGALTIETRKKVFWTLYTLDCFSAAMLGLPKLLKDDDIHAEYPSDTDDEYVTEKGFQPTLPGEFTRLSSALALFRVSRILARVLEKNYPAATSHDLSLQQIAGLDAELSDWSENLPAHLKLNFVQDKPSTDITGSRSPILALAYYYIRTLIHRPAVGSSLGNKAASSLIAVGESSKHLVQIIQLLEERSMSFSFCLNKTDVLVVCAMSLLYQSLDLNHESKLMKDAERLVNAVLKILQRMKAPGSYDLRRVASMLIAVDELPQPTPMRASPDTTMAAPPSRPSPQSHSSRKKPTYNLDRHPGATMSETDLLSQQEKLRRMTMPSMPNGRPDLYRSQSRSSFDNSSAEQAPPPRREHRFSISQIQQTMMRMSPTHKAKPNLDYLSLNHNTPSVAPQQQPQHQPQSPIQTRMPASSQSMASTPAHPTQLYPPNQMAPQQQHHKPGGGGFSIAEWEALLGAMDGGQVNVYDAIYGGPALSSLSAETPTPTSSTAATNFGAASGGDWSPDTWDLSSISLGDHLSAAAPPQSVLSISDDSLSSGDDLASNDMYLSIHSEDFATATATATTNGGMLHQHQAQQSSPQRSSHDGGCGHHHGHGHGHGHGHLGFDGLDLGLGL